MCAIICNLWRDEAGFVVSAELVMLGTVLVIGLVAGAACVQEAVIGESTEVAGALRGLDQSYSTSGMQGCWDPCCGFGSWTAGSAYYQNPADREACFGLCPPYGVAYPPIIAPPCAPVVPCLEAPPIVPGVVPTVPPIVVPPVAVPPVAVPTVPAPCVAVVKEPRPCPCELSECPPTDDGACPQPTVVPLPGPFVW